MRLFYRKPVIMFRTSPISLWRSLATRTSLSCSTRILLSLTLQFSHSRPTLPAKVPGVWFLLIVRGLRRRLSLTHWLTDRYFCAVHIHNVVAKKRDASTDLLQRLHGYMREHNVDFIGGDFNMSAFSTVGDVFTDEEFSAPGNTLLWGLGALDEPNRACAGFLILPKRPYEWRVHSHGCYKFDNALLGLGPRDQSAHLPVFLHLRNTNLPGPSSVMRSEQAQQRRFERRHDKERMQRRRSSTRASQTWPYVKKTYIIATMPFLSHLLRLPVSHSLASCVYPLHWHMDVLLQVFVFVFSRDTKVFKFVKLILRPWRTEKIPQEAIKTQLSQRDNSSLSEKKNPQNLLIENQTLAEEKQLNSQDEKNDPKNATPSLSKKKEKTQLTKQKKEKKPPCSISSGPSSVPSEMKNWPLSTVFKPASEHSLDNFWSSISCSTLPS